MLTTAENQCRGRYWKAGALSLLVAMVLEIVCWGFTVDDAWIIARIAARGAATGIFSFNPGGPVTDAVTPLGFAHLLGYLGQALGLEAPVDFWWLARWLGICAYGASFFLAGAWSCEQGSSNAAARGRRGFPWGAPLAAALSVPAAAWAGAGLSTPLVGLVFLLGAKSARERPHSGRAYVLLGAAAAWRPELLPVSLAVATLQARVFCKKRPASDKKILQVGWVILPALVVAGLRQLTFGHFLPLAAQAKEATLESGLFYATVTALWAGLPWLLFVARKKGEASPWVWIWATHLLALVYAGGDWMPAMRLSAPLYPWLAWRIGSELSLSRWRVLWLVPAIGGPGALLVSQSADFRLVASRRLALVEAGRTRLQGATKVAAVDIGWVGLATSASIVDLAGVTDPSIAALPGGHTSKAIYPGLFSDREVDAWVIRAADRNFRLGDGLESVAAVYAVDARLLRRHADIGFVASSTIPLLGTRGQYVIARRQTFAESDVPRRELSVSFVDRRSMSFVDTRWLPEADTRWLPESVKRSLQAPESSQGAHDTSVWGTVDSGPESDWRSGL